MADKIIWSAAARDDLRGLVRTIAADDPALAEQFAYRLMQQADKLGDFPELGRQIPEKRDPTLREIMVVPYRVIYRVRQHHVIEIVRVWHGARGDPRVG